MYKVLYQIVSYLNGFISSYSILYSLRPCCSDFCNTFCALERVSAWRSELVSGSSRRRRAKDAALT